MDAVQDMVLGTAWTSLPPAGKVFFSVGAVMGLSFALRVLRWVWAFFLRPAVNLKKLGKWGIVTGATDGIGKAIAMQLAKKGLSVILVSRTQSRLDAAKDEIKAKYPNVDVKTIACDFSKATDKDYQNIKAEIARADGGIAVLYNNVGVSYEHADVLQDLSDEQMDAILEVNMRALVKMTKLVLPKMKEARRGVVVNVSSFEGAITAPFYAVYGASKAFVDSFSKSMAVELQGTGVKCATHPALLVATKLSIPNEKRRKGSLFTPWPEQWAAGSVNAVGYEEHAHPYWAHSLQAGVFLALPAALKNKIRYDMNSLIRKIALKKKNAK